MENDSIITNTITLGATGMAVMNPVQALTIVSLCVAIIANLLVIWKTLKKKDKNDNTQSGRE